MAEVLGGVGVAGMSHELLGLVSGALRNAQIRWPIIDEEMFTIENTRRRLEYSLWEGFDFCRNDRSLEYIVRPYASSLSPSNMTDERLQRWSVYLR